MPKRYSKTVVAYEGIALHVEVEVRGSAPVSA